MELLSIAFEKELWILLSFIISLEKLRLTNIKMFQVVFVFL